MVQVVQDLEVVFNWICGVCYDGQLLMVLKKGDYVVWELWLVKGMLILVQYVINGFNVMLFCGLCIDCSVEDYQVIIQWMVKKQLKFIIFYFQL